MGVNSLSKTVTRHRRGCDFNPGPSPAESSTLTTRLLRRLKMRDLMLKYSGIWGLICDKTALIIAKTSTSLQLSVSDMLTRVNFPTFAMADLRHGGLILQTLKTGFDESALSVIALGRW